MEDVEIKIDSNIISHIVLKANSIALMGKIVNNSIIDRDKVIRFHSEIEGNIIIDLLEGGDIDKGNIDIICLG